MIRPKATRSRSLGRNLVDPSLMHTSANLLLVLGVPIDDQILFVAQRTRSTIGPSRPGSPQGRTPQSVVDSREKFLPIERLLEQTVVTRAHGARPIQHLGVTGDEDDWQPRPCRLNHSY